MGDQLAGSATDVEKPVADSKMKKHLAALLGNPLRRRICVYVVGLVRPVFFPIHACTLHSTALHPPAAETELLPEGWHLGAELLPAAEGAVHRIGRPWEIGDYERFNSEFSDELLNGKMFATLCKAQVPSRGPPNPPSLRTNSLMWSGVSAPWSARTAI